MLDRNDGATQVKTRLSSAFDAWAKQNPKTHTKAELARRCESVGGRPCTPQTVGGWFKTGRMNKVWLPVVEQVLGVSLGFSAELSSGEVPAWPFKRITPSQYASLPESVHEMTEAMLIEALRLGEQPLKAPAANRS